MTRRNLFKGVAGFVAAALGVKAVKANDFSSLEGMSASLTPVKPIWVGYDLGAAEGDRQFITMARDVGASFVQTLSIESEWNRHRDFPGIEGVWWTVSGSEFIVSAKVFNPHAAYEGVRRLVQCFEKFNGREPILVVGKGVFCAIMNHWRNKVTWKTVQSGRVEIRCDDTLHPDAILIKSVITDMLR